MRRTLATSAFSPRALTFVASAALLAPAPGCVSVTSPPGYGNREMLGFEQIEATPWVMITDAPHSLESSAGRLAIETLAVDRASLSPKFSRSVRLTVAGSSRVDVVCAHEPEGAAYPPPFERVEAAAFVCLGVIDSERVTLAVERSCYRGVVTFGETERYTLTRGNVTIAGAALPSDEVSIHDERGALVAAFDLVTSMTFRVWSEGRSERDPTRARFIVVAAALHDWTTYASAQSREACN